MEKQKGNTCETGATKKEFKDCKVEAFTTVNSGLRFLVYVWCDIGFKMRYSQVFFNLAISSGGFCTKRPRRPGGRPQEPKIYENRYCAFRTVPTICLASTFFLQGG